jgi:transcription factor IIIB subunit 2
MICANCGFVVSDTQITQDLQFGEAANGAAVVQGAFVGADQENARNMSGGSKLTGGQDGRQMTRRLGENFISQYVTALHLTGTHKERANRTFGLAVSNNFIQGRVTNEVAAVCLYVGCRMDSECKIMLIDLAELLDMSVFDLGRIFKDLVDALGLRGGTDDRPQSEIFDVNPENLVHRFAGDLEFGADTNRIANEAVQILRRMRKDWIHVGRRHAGVCAAALILAARMNNYRRTIREVVYTAKVCDITIHKRLEEFKYTAASKLTVTEFRHHGLLLQEEHDPPAYYEQFMTKNKRKRRGRDVADDEEEEEEEGDDDEVDDDQNSRSPSAAPSNTQTDAHDTQDGMGNGNVPPGSTSETQATSGTQESQARTNMSPTAQARADRAAMPPPRDPIDPALLDGDTNERQLIAAGAGDLGALAARHGEPVVEENDVEEDGEEDGEADEEEVYAESAVGTKRKRAGRPKGSKNKPLPQLTDSAVDDQERIEAEVGDILEDDETLALASETHRALGSTMETIDDSLQSLDNDPEVANCLLNPAEIAIKERIWVHENAQYLREKQARKIKHDLAVASGTAHTKKTRKRQRGRMGDKNWIRGENGEDLPKTPGEASARMLEKRGYSKKLNYDKIRALYEPRESRSKSKTGSARDSASVQPEAESAATTPQPDDEREGYASLTKHTTSRPRKESDTAPAVDKTQSMDIDDHVAEDEDEEEDPDDYIEEDVQEEQYEFGEDDEEGGYDNEYD